MLLPNAGLFRTFLMVSITLMSGVSHAADTSIRESHTVRVGAVEETWQLRWLAKPVPICTPPDPSWITCLCSGFEYGQQGPLALIRMRSGKEIDRLDLNAYFNGDYSVTADGAVLRYKPVLTSDFDQAEDRSLAKRIAGRQTVGVMSFADYNHDGQATEFVLQTETEPCGKHYGVAFGVTPQSPKLHAFASIAHPEQPLLLPIRMWDLLRTSRGPHRLIAWRCGDHLSDVETELEVEATAKGFRAVTRDFDCSENDERGKLREEQSL